MDINGLNALFNSGNWSLIQPAMEQFNTAGEKAKADVAESQARANRSNTLLPADLAHTQALTRQSNVTSDATQDTLDVKRGVPMADRTQEYWNELRGKSSDAQLKVISNNMEAMRHYASKPTLTLEDQTTMRQQYPGLFEQLSKPGGRQVAMQAYDDFVKHSADYQKNKYTADQHLAGIKYATDNKQFAPGKEGGGKPTGGTTIEAINADLSKYKKATEKLAHLKVVLPQASPEVQQALQPVYAGIKKQAEAELQAGQAGKVDLAATTKGRVSTNPPVDLGESGANTPPAKPAPVVQRVTIYKDGKVVGTIPANQADQARAQGYQIK